MKSLINTVNKGNVPNIYLFLRIRQLFISKRYRIWYALIYLFLVLDYPINKFLIEGNFELKYNLIVKNIYPLSWGYQKVLNTHVFVTCGIMLWGPPVRTAGKSEIVVVDVDFR